MRWSRRHTPEPEIDLDALEQGAADRLAEAHVLHAEVLARVPEVDAAHKRTAELRKRNQWAALVEGVMNGNGH